MGSLLGSVIGIGIAFGLIADAWHRQLHATFGSPWRLLGIVVVVTTVAGKLLSGVFPRIVGSTALFVALGSLVATLLAAFRGQLAYAGPLLLLVLSCGAIQKWARLALLVQEGYASSLDEAEGLDP